MQSTLLIANAQADAHIALPHSAYARGKPEISTGRYHQLLPHDPLDHFATFGWLFYFYGLDNPKKGNPETMSNEKQRPKKEMPVSPGRPKGVPNKLTTEVKQMILDALDSVGGVAYLADKAESHPQAFLSLVGKVLPLQVNGAGPNGEHLFTGIKVEFVNSGNGKVS